MKTEVSIEAAILWEYERSRLGGEKKRRMFAVAVGEILGDYLGEQDNLTRSVLVFILKLLDDDLKESLLQCIEFGKKKGYL